MENKKKPPSFAKMVSEALTTSSGEDKDLNAKAILSMISEKYEIKEDKMNLKLICQELERGKTAGEFLQTKGNTMHGFFKLNPEYIPPSECQEKEPPAYLNPPSPRPCSPVKEIPKSTKNKPPKQRKGLPRESEETLFKFAFSVDGKLFGITPDGRIESVDPNKSSISVPDFASRDIEKYSYDSFDDKTMKLISEQSREANMYLDRNFKQVDKKQTDETDLDIDDYQPPTSSVNSINLDIDSDEKPTSSKQLNAQDVAKLVEEKKQLDPKVKEIMERGIIKTYVNYLQSKNVVIQRKGAYTLYEFIVSTEHHRQAIIELGSIPILVKCICMDDLIGSGYALNCLIELWKNSPQTRRMILDTNITGNLLTLALSKTSKDAAKPSSNSVPSFSKQIAKLSNTEDVRISEKNFADLMNIVLVLFEQNNTNAFKTVSECFFWLTMNNVGFYKRFDMTKENFETILSAMDKSPISDYMYLICTFVLIMEIVPEQAKLLADLGLLNKMPAKWDDLEFGKYLFICSYFIMENHEQGKKLLFDSNTVPKILPFLCSENENIRHDATLMILDISTAYPEIQLHIQKTQLFFNQMVKNVKEFDLA